MPSVYYSSAEAFDFRDKSIAIVGNGPNELGSGNGPVIDSHDIVIRINNFRLIRPYDYGERVTHWATSFASDITKPFYPVEGIFWTLPFLSLFGANIRLAMEYMETGQLHQIPQSTYNKMPLFSTGLTLLHWIAEERGSLDGIDLYGFSFFNPEKQHHYYEEDTAENDNANKKASHCYEAELREFNRLMEKTKPSDIPLAQVSSVRPPYTFEKSTETETTAE